MPFVWNVSPTLFSFGPLEVRWYGLLFALSFYLGLSLMQWIYRRENIEPLSIDRCLTYSMLGIVIGARLGHCLFYDPAYFLSHPLDILKVWQGGLASHGAGVGWLVGLWLYCRQSKTETMIWIMDRLSLALLLGAALIRIGNFINSEILGTPSDLPWAVIFSYRDLVARHPVQLYESFTYATLFVALLLLYLKTAIAQRSAMMVGFSLSGIFAARIILECFKERMAHYELFLSMSVGQLLSIPFLIFGLTLLYRGWRAQSCCRSTKTG